MRRINTRLAACSAAVICAAGTLLAGAPAASAAPRISFGYDPTSNGYNIYPYSDGIVAGAARWLQDPEGSYPGDTLEARDSYGDGYGVEAHLTTNPQRIATTRGHGAPYADLASGNLPEGKKYYMYVCMVKGDYSNCSDSVAVYA
ncbi:hypothetical protein ACGFNU_11470 [Spirillospora sp. NPDC048911]|uniref:hypothetical protein n=1 Tax=Spirillospora sp. NPDC048911 TaxID=3364527 RepID=UPI00371518B6